MLCVARVKARYGGTAEETREDEGKETTVARITGAPGVSSTAKTTSFLAPKSVILSIRLYETPMGILRYDLHTYVSYPTRLGTLVPIIVTQSR